MISLRILLVTLLLASYTLGQDQGTTEGTAEGSTDASNTETTTAAETTLETEGTTETTSTQAAESEGGGGGATSEGSAGGEEEPVRGRQPATCDPCMKKTAPFKAMYKKNPKNVVQIWTSMCKALGLTGATLRECRQLTDSKPGRETAEYNLGDRNVTPKDICAGFKLCKRRGGL